MIISIFNYKRVYSFQNNKTEIDFILRGENTFEAVEVKWNNPKRPRSFDTIEALYPGIKTTAVTSESFVKG